MSIGVPMNKYHLLFPTPSPSTRYLRPQSSSSSPPAPCASTSKTTRMNNQQSTNEHNNSRHSINQQTRCYHLHYWFATRYVRERRKAHPCFSFRCCILLCAIAKSRLPTSTSFREHCVVHHKVSSVWHAREISTICILPGRDATIIP